MKSDYEYVKRAQQGDQLAFSYLLKKHYGHLFYFILQKVRNYLDAEDVTIDTFTKAFMNINSFNPTSRFSTWLFTIGKNTSIDFIRYKAIKFQAGEFTYNILNTKSDYLNPEIDMIHKEESDKRDKLFKGAFEQLNDYQKKVIKLYYMEGYKSKDIASKLNKPGSTVRVDLKRTKQKLQIILSNKLN